MLAPRLVPENAIVSSAAMMNLARLRPHASGIPLPSVHLDRDHVDDPCGQQHEEQGDVQHMPQREQPLENAVLGDALTRADTALRVFARDALDARTLRRKRGG